MVLRLPLPPGSLTKLYNNYNRFVESYLRRFPGYYETGDAGCVDGDGYVYILGRTDDVINVAGHRLSTGAMEEILMSHPDVAECAAIPLKDALNGEVPIGFVITNAGSTTCQSDLKEQLVERVRETIGSIACFKKVAVITALPKTRSGKMLRGTMAKIANNQEYKVTPTIEDERVFDDLAPIIRGLAGSR
jgi:propionyl-CoA synthetase